MSRNAIVLCCGLVLLLSLGFIAFGAALEGAPHDAGTIGRFALRGLVLAGGAAVIPAIAWAFGRFRADRALVPLLIWAALAMLGGAGVVVGTNFKKVATGFVSQPGAREQFERSARASAKSQCVSAVLKRNPDHLSKDRIDAFCECYAADLAHRLAPEDLVDLILSSKEVTERLREQAREAGMNCRRTVLQQGG